MSRAAALGLLVLSAAACGYRSALPGFESVHVAAVRSRAPEPELAACLTSGLREGLAARGVRVSSGAALRLEGEILEAGAAPSTLAVRDGELEPVDQAASVVFRARLVEEGRGVVWGPEAYRVTALAAQGPGPLESSVAARAGLDRACRDVVERVLDDLAE